MKIFILGMLLIVSACSSLSKDDCTGANWQKKGYTDGSRGIDPAKLSDYKNECAEHGLGVDSEQYVMGHKQGLIYYCTYKNGLDAGLEGEDFRPLCGPVGLAFNRGYEEGYRVFKIQELEKKEAKKHVSIIELRFSDVAFDYLFKIKQCRI